MNNILIIILPLDKKLCMMIELSKSFSKIDKFIKKFAFVYHFFTQKL